MVKTNLIPWQHEAIIVTILTERKLTQEEEKKIIYFNKLINFT